MSFPSNLRYISITIVALTLLAGCKDYNELDLEPVDSGEADFSSYVAVGNSLTAGYQNNALYESAQQFSYPAIVARQLRLEDSFSQPLISDPGIGGRIELVNLIPAVITPNQNQGEPVNQEEKPFDNLGIPGAVLVDYLNPNNSGGMKERATDPANPSYNPFYGIVLEASELEKEAPNVHNQVVKQNPTLITFWLGNNDVLGFVSSGGQGQPTDPAQFSQLYQATADSLAGTGASVVAYNIPDVTSVPFVFLLRLQLQQQGAIALNPETRIYEFITSQGNFPIWIDVNGTPEEMGESDFLLLSGLTYFNQVQAGQIPPPIQPDDAVPDSLVLDGPRGGEPGSSELEQAVGALSQYNTTIGDVASSSGFALVDMNEIFNSIISDFQSSGGSGGYQANGLILQPVPGSLFSFDGIHVSNRGAAVIANETIRAMNSTFGSDVPEVDISVIPEGQPVHSDGETAFSF